MPAGLRGGDEFPKYARRVHAFDWNDFYSNWDGELYFDWLHNAIKDMADIVLVDARTGVTEMSGVCAYQLPDVVILFVTASQQNFDGTLMMAQSLSDKAFIEEGRNGSPLPLIFVPSRVDNYEGGKINIFQKKFNQTFKDFFPPKIKRRVDDLFLNFKTPYVPYYSYEEQIAVRNGKEASAKDLMNAYDKLTDALAMLAPEDNPVRSSFY